MLFQGWPRGCSRLGKGGEVVPAVLLLKASSVRACGRSLASPGFPYFRAFVGDFSRAKAKDPLD